ncbi:adenylate/guanylate cyclase domain-containing protein [Halalkalibaculum sp. DA3122]|uniref:adenylate/guanylate cyclase domain-containing protein n=1 Tax=unclassified Halalkalibaculum TaxID=2964617 RepID=UPI0037548F8E
MFEQTYKILIVDDVPSLVTTLRYKLTKKDFEVITAQNGEDALEICREEKPDLVISDLEMPVMDGYELCRSIKEDPELNTTPVILLTFMHTTENLMKGIEAGADNYLTKPYDDKTLFSKIRELLENPVAPPEEADRKAVTIDGREYHIEANWPKVLNLLVSTYNNSVAQKEQLEETRDELNDALEELEYVREEHQELLHNIFPEKIAEQLIAFNKVTPELYSDVSILFTDFTGFSRSVTELDPEEFIEKLSHYFDNFDSFSAEYGVEKIKTIGDSYMAVGGLPERNKSHAVDTALTALRILKFTREEHEKEQENWNIRIGINTGEVLVGVIGKKRFAYDVWGSAVNLASRMEETSSRNAVNISEQTYRRIRDFFECEARGEIEVKNMGSVPMYFLRRIKPELSEDQEGYVPNREFGKKYNAAFGGE